jgi:hypothetical protein
MTQDPHDATTPLRQQHTPTPADLEALEGAGVFSVARPGTPEADDFDAAIGEDLAAFDAEMIEREGPDALTSDRALRLSTFKQQQAAERLAELQHAEQDDDLVGYVLATFRRQRDWTREQLADWLGIAVDDLTRMAVERRPLAVTQ